jgi:multimeric flavodoxin WrbA
MTKKIFLISGSPRKGGNYDTLCEQFMPGAEKAGHRAEKIFLRDKNIESCSGCGVFHGGRKPCQKEDDMADILQKVIDSDTIVMATPVYFYTMGAQMKTFIDRTCARYTEIRNKKFYFIVTAADSSLPSMERTIEDSGDLPQALSLPGKRGSFTAPGHGAWVK